MNPLGGDRGGLGDGGKWSHNPSHRGGAPYGDRATSDRFGGSGRGDSLSNRQSAARNQISRQGGNLGSARSPGGGSISRGNAPGISNRGSGTGSRGGSGLGSSNGLGNRSSSSGNRSNGLGSGSRSGGFNSGSSGNWGGGGTAGIAVAVHPVWAARADPVEAAVVVHVEAAVADAARRRPWRTTLTEVTS